MTNKTPDSFEVRELRGGNPNTAFEYRTIAKRSGFEDRRMEQLQSDSETVQAMREQYYKPEYDQSETRHLQMV